MASSPVRFVKQYSNHIGNVFMRFEYTDASGVLTSDILVRRGRQGLWLYTRREAREQAEAAFAARA